MDLLRVGQERDVTRNIKTLQKQLQRLEKESGSLEHSYSEILEIYHNSLYRVFASEEIANRVTGWLGWLQNLYVHLVRKQATFLAKDSSEKWVHLVVYWYIYSSIPNLFRSLDSHGINVGCNEDYFLLHEDGLLPHNQVSKRLFEEVWDGSIRGFANYSAEELVGDSKYYQETIADTIRRSLTAIFNESSLPRLQNVFEDLGPLFEERQKQGEEKFAIYFAIALSKFYKGILEMSSLGELLTLHELQSMHEVQRYLRDKMISNQEQKAFDTVFCYLEKLRLDMERSKIPVSEFDIAMAEVDKTRPVYEEFSLGYYIEYMKGKRQIMVGDYDHAYGHLSKAFEDGRYRYGGRAKEISYHLMVAAAKSNNGVGKVELRRKRAMFKRAYFWETYVCANPTEDAFTGRPLTEEEAWRLYRDYNLVKFSTV
ncbi:MAG: hypothetical protein GX994_03740 [Firmicutes bacterium]|nr:hypothetical protein [Bacillota bacterium]